MTKVLFMIGMMLFLKCNFGCKKKADGATYADGDRIAPINGSHCLIRHMMIKSTGKIVYDTDNLHNVKLKKSS